jgi:hypothetical protein
MRYLVRLWIKLATDVGKTRVLRVGPPGINVGDNIT